MNEQAEALGILASARSSLIERVCRIVCENREAFERCAEGEPSPLSSDRELAKAAGDLVRLNAVLAAMASSDTADAPFTNASVPQHLAKAFAHYVELVNAGHMEEASHLLSGMLSMPLDRMVTATRFFSRANKANPQVVELLWLLLNSVHEASSAQLMDLMVKTFGFQAVESGMAIQALRDSTVPGHREANGRIPAARS